MSQKNAQTENSDPPLTLETLKADHADLVNTLVTDAIAAYQTKQALANPSQQMQAEHSGANAQTKELEKKSQKENEIENKKENEKIHAENRESERQRIGAIIGAADASGREQLAQHLAFSTDMNAETAIATLRAAPKKQTPLPQPRPPAGLRRSWRALGTPR